MQLPGLAGWYSFWVPAVNAVDPQGQFHLLPEKGINYYAKFAVYYGPLAGKLTPYPDTVINQPQLNLIDQNHLGQTSRNFLPWVSQEITNGSIEYEAALKNGYNTIPVAQNVVNVWRGSLEDGGIADNFPNYTTSYSANWTTPEWEEHAHGSEVDVYNPSINANPGYAIPGASLSMLASFIDSGCNPGLFVPNTMSEMSSYDALFYWNAQSWMHLTCAHSALIHYTPGHGQ
jgi:hypothetical protein